jgi:PAS domain S-box-containing protein
MTNPRGLRALLIATDRDGSSLLRESLTCDPRHPVALTAVASVAEARPVLTAGGVELILLFIERSDVERLDEIRGLAPETPVLVLSAEADPALADQAVELGAVELFVVSQAGPLLPWALHSALARWRAEGQIADLARYPAENPNPVMRIAEDGAVLHANAPGVALLHDLGTGIGKPAPERWRKAVAAACASGQIGALDAEVGDRIYSLSIAAGVEHRYANLYARNVTEQRAAGARVEHLHRVLLAIRKVDQLIVREKDPQRLIAEACRMLVESLGYRSAWIALAPGIEAEWSLASAGVGPAIEAFARQLESGSLPKCCQGVLGSEAGLEHIDAGSHCEECPAREAHDGDGLAVVALRSAERNLGLLGISSERPLATDEEELDLIREIAEDLAFALGAIEGAARRRQSEERYFFLFTNMLEGYAHCRMVYRDGAPEDFVLLDVNDAFGRLTGLRDVAGRRVTEAIPGIRESNPELFEIFGRVATTGVSERFETFVAPLDRWFSISAHSPAREHFVAVFDVITERKRSEAALRESEARYRLIAENASDVIWTADLTKRITYVSPSFQRLTGFSPEETLGPSGIERILTRASLERVDQALAEALAQDSAAAPSLELEHRKKDGGTVWVEVKFTIVRGPDGIPTGVMGVSRDISEKRALQASIAQSDRLASMGLLAAGVAHEINNPLSYVLYNLESVLEELPGFAGTEDLAARVSESLDGTRRIRDIARALGTFSRVEPGAVRDVEVRDAAEHAISMAYNEIKYRARLVKDFQTVPKVVGSEGKLAQVFLNLLINAAHAIDEGDVEHNEIGVSTWSEADLVFAEVRDTGRGIAPEYGDRIFEPFFTTKGVAAGSGLGLAICQNIVRTFGGTISFQSEPGRGSRFRIALPRQPVGDSPSRQSSTRPPVRAARGRILVVDDEAAIQRALGRMLGRAHRVVTVSSGEEARAMLDRDQDFDVILCDLMMARMSGMDLHQWLAQHQPDLAGRVVFMSGGAFTPLARDYLAKVPNTRLEKPLDSRLVQDVIALAVAGRRDAEAAAKKN